MKVHLIKKQSIEDFVSKNTQGKRSFEDWLGKIKHADWAIPNDIQSTFASADLLGNSSKRVVFNIGGNSYKMICKYAFGDKQVHLFICWIGTHGEYDKLNTLNRQYIINLF